MVNESDLVLPDGGRLHVYDTGGDGFPVVWHHGTPNIGAPPEPLFTAADRLGLRWVSYDRPGYGGSTARPGRDIASAAAYTARLADRFGLERFAAVGHSGGGPHALAVAALLGDRVTAAVDIAGLAPRDAGGLDWFAGMYSGGVASLEAAIGGREAKEEYESRAEYDPAMFTEADHAALEGEWSWVGRIAGLGTATGLDGLVDDDLAYVAPWGFDPTEAAVPLLLLHGERDRVVPASHSRRLAGHCPTAELRLYPEDGHVSVLGHAEAALEWLRERS
ncbi:alpha/beta fold hydrolase [Glycomyces arizonensis]|uniref:alpha/beta fold hydrolase n=1 Tax=Glycomyces arizonensis TaxID=256035 RepID=UPI0004796435|nr:alpha/beta fold hydrolase [Glycomyces arizonensis]